MNNDTKANTGSNKNNQRNSNYKNLRKPQVIAIFGSKKVVESS